MAEFMLVFLLREGKISPLQHTTSYYLRSGHHFAVAQKETNIKYSECKLKVTLIRFSLLLNEEN